MPAVIFSPPTSSSRSRHPWSFGARKKHHELRQQGFEVIRDTPYQTIYYNKRTGQRYRVDHGER